MPLVDGFTANDDSITINEDVSTTVLASELISNDLGNNLSLVEVSNPVNGTVSLNEDGNIEFTPDADFSGTAGFDYTVTDGTENSTASVEVIVNSVNDPLTLTSEIPDITVLQNTPESIVVLSDYFEDIEDGDKIP